MSLKLHNSLTRQREEFTPLNPPKVGIYVCGPTVYGHSHLGHAKSYISFDAIIRWLRFSGYDVNYVQNITDVGHLTDDADEGEDKIIAEARRRGLHPMAVADTFVKSYLDDMDLLNVARPDIMPRATGHIPEQIEAAVALLEKGHAYEVNGSVYFNVGSFKEYGKLSGRKVEEMEAGARVAVNEEKRHPADFALWKRAEPGHLMRWNSPWGVGYPGWHLECSVMSQKYIGDTLDIHGGGMENKFPHHECEIAQGECLTGSQFVRYWLHNNMCTVNGQKMGKSLGNAILLKQVFDGSHDLLEQPFEPVVVRHLVLTSHYRQPLDFSNAALCGAESGSYKLRDALRELSRAAGSSADKNDGTSPTEGGTAVPAVKQAADGGIPAPITDAIAMAKTDAIRDSLADVGKRFADAMNEDFNTAAAIATLFDLSKQSTAWIAGGADKADLQAADTLFRRLSGDALGMRWEAALGAGDTGKQDDLISLLVDLRGEARKSKNFELSDTIRDRLAALGVNLKDGPDGTTW